MAQYVDGFLLAIPKKNLTAYQRIARKAGKIWRDHGALAYVECAGDDMKAEHMIPFTKLAKAKEDEVVIFAWAVFKSRRDRDKANAAIMSDLRISEMCDDSSKLFDCKRMAYGGFKTIVQL